MQSLYTGTGLSPILGPGKASDNACRLQAPWLACPDWEACNDKEKRSVHRVFDVKGGRHFAVFPVFLGWSAGKTQLHQSSTFNRASVHRLWVWLWTLSATPKALTLGFGGLRITTYKNSIALQLVITSALSRGGWIMKLMKHVLQSLSLFQPLSNPKGALGLWLKQRGLYDPCPSPCLLPAFCLWKTLVKEYV